MQSFQRHMTQYANYYLLHNTYEVILHILYYDSHPIHFPARHNPRSSTRTIKTPFLTGITLANRYDLESSPNQLHTRL